MADADVIPLGARGRPGRGGSRSGTPSSAARSLAAGNRSDARQSTGPNKRPKSPSETRPERSPDVAGDETADLTDATTEPEGGSRAEIPAESTTASAGPAAGSPGPASSEPPTADAAGVASTDDSADGAVSAPGAPHVSPAPPAADEVFVERRGGRMGFDLAAAIGNAAREVFGDDWETSFADFLAFLRRRVTGDYVIDEFGFDPDVTTRLSMATMRPLVEKWFRVDVQGIENIPVEGGALLVANHSGTVPLDGLVTGLVVHDHADRYLRMLGADLVFRLPFIGEMARKGGATLACSEDAERMLAQGELVGVWPEGFKGVGKPFSERYTLQRFGRGGFVSAALHTRVPIVPCSIVGAEEIYPLVGNLPTLARLLGVPYVPITPFFPWLGPLGMIPLPSKWLIEFGEPIRTDALTDEQVEDPMIVFNLTDQVRETIQQTLYALLMQRRNVFF
ncbi:MAG TPA: 1-acyl-sn-glycerol-3-phosphate acyltransferase [Nocardioidaceae bacterium]|nr:1-acyl-sn-glycerol-3-phosphate acyltransferase [Nocardioidaceae bacterium]